MKGPAYFPSSTENAALVKTSPVRPEREYGPQRIIRAVIVQMTIVSRKTSKIPQTPWCAGSCALDDACGIVEEPTPASLEKTPLA